MARPPSLHPTDRELAILQVLWESGPSTVKEVQQALNTKEGKTTAYNSVLTIMQIMANKGFVTRDETQRSHVYRAAQSQDETQEQIVEDLVDRLFKGSALNLVTKAIAPKQLSPEERQQLKELLEQMEGE